MLLTGVKDFLPAWTNVGPSLDDLKLLASSAMAKQTFDCKLCFKAMASKVVDNPLLIAIGVFCTKSKYFSQAPPF